MIRSIFKPTGWIKGARAASFSARDIKFVQKENLNGQPANVDQEPFGSVFTDHMLEINWTTQNGWTAPQIMPFKDIQLHPASSCLHYAVQTFQDFIISYRSDGKVVLFRPDYCMDQLYNSAVRATLPVFDRDELQICMQYLICSDWTWVPKDPNMFLIARMAIVGTEQPLGLAPTETAKCSAILSPVSPRYPMEKSISLYVDSSVVRTFPGGCGGYNLGSNYATTILQQGQANEKGFDQNLWLFGPDGIITQTNSMNIIIYWKNENGENELITPTIEDNLVTPGVIRDSVLTLAWELEQFLVTERTIKMSELVKAFDDGRVYEIFAVGTETNICSVGKIWYNDQEYKLPVINKDETLAAKLLSDLIDIQTGNVTRPEWQVVF